MDLPSPKTLSKSDLMMIAVMKGLKGKKTLKQDELFKILKKNVKSTYNESPFKSIILDIRSILPKKRMQKNLKNVLNMLKK